MLKDRLIDRIDTSTPDVFYDQAFRIMIEQHLDQLKESRTTVGIDITPALALGYDGNLNGLLYAKNIPPYMHWIVMRINDMDSSYDYTSDMLHLIVPSPEAINNLRELFNTIHSI